MARAVCRVRESGQKSEMMLPYAVVFGKILVYSELKLILRSPPQFVVVGETCLCRFHPSGWLRASALTCRSISLVGVKWSCLRINKQAF